MISENLHIADLIRRSLTGSLTDDDRQELHEWLTASPRNRALYERILNSNYTQDAAMTTFFNRRRPITSRVGVLLRYAAVVLVALVGSYLFLYQTDEQVPDKQQPLEHNYAEATLIRNGEAIALKLTDEQNALPDGIEVRKDDEGLLLSHNNEATDISESSEEVVMNRLVVPRGCDFRLELSDGTVVYLNANSELIYPESFAAKRREVTLRGMAYFEVSKDASRPFVVQTSSSQIEVLGTEFCVEDYAGRPHLTTLVSGSVAVKSGEQRCLLIPGQQADISPEGLTIREVDTYYYKAWKEGYFLFRHTPLNELMATLAEWYDLKYTFEDRSLEKILISARLYKLDDADQLFAILAATNKVKFRRQGKEVTLVRP